MGRLDQQLIDLKGKLLDALKSRVPTSVEDLQQQVKSREKQLLPVYTQIATRFAELHDSSFRMAAKGVIREVVEWGSSRSFFYKRLNRRVSEGSLIRIVRDAAGDQLSHKSAMELIKSWFLVSKTAEVGENSWLDDEAFFAWKNDPMNYEVRLHELRVQKILHQLSEIGKSPSDLEALPQSLAALLSKVEESRRAHLVKELQKVLS
ncbi:hypothetical protein Sjap_018699 [Stephania japonica]|uniref:Acetyl-coenzyme A carboxylase carboxyl transferase subunit beta domain-containing protein n=1 Tax=Stephania japonica TaxID=461633 RepID=A0AAP0I8I1_9MAGN